MYTQILVATTNKNKVKRIKNLLADIPIKIVSLEDLEINAPEPDETALSCVGIAAQKALAYLDCVDDSTVVLAQDDTISFEDVDPADNPGPAIKEPVKNRFGEFTDENALIYYTELAKKYGGSISMTFLYGHAVAFKETGVRKLVHVHAGESRLVSKLVDAANKPETVPGYFLAAVMQLNLDNEWKNYTDLSEQQLINADSDLKDSILSLLDFSGILNNSKKANLNA